ncbi:hypothetical protein C8P66_11323 [Humitalea rosea]|uniref:Uncharacterized protein n=1 Tax=Humitalea rosea TaxID=990373 RepID=A0A2W7ID17_9PROT|nr:hypothetical protein [Humitalea rosea]PZW44856.1 hypothetical protein C8P66_11323 [Humitalea rosea]
MSGIQRVITNLLEHLIALPAEEAERHRFVVADPAGTGLLSLPREPLRRVMKLALAPPSGDPDARAPARRPAAGYGAGFDGFRRPVGVAPASSAGRPRHGTRISGSRGGGDLLGLEAGERAWIDGERALAVVRFGQTAGAESAWRLVEDGIAQNASVGFTYSREATEPLAGTDALLCRRWRPREISLVPVPADWNAGFLPRDLGAEEMRRALDAEDALLVWRAKAARRLLNQAELEGFAAAAGPALAAALGSDLDLTNETLRAEAVRYAAA